MKKRERREGKGEMAKVKRERVTRKKKLKRDERETKVKF